MNERIKQLLDQAQELAREEIKSTPEFEKYAPSYAIPGTEIHVGLRLSYEKFAELIVAECSRVIVNGGYRNPALGEKHPLTPPEIAQMVEEHFGVEE